MDAPQPLFPVTRPPGRRHKQKERRIITVTGGNGFLGRSIVKALLHTDWVAEVRVLDKCSRSDAAELFKEDSEDKLRYIEGSILNKSDVIEALHNAYAVIHTVAILNDGFLPPDAVEAVNIEGTRTLLDVCVELGGQCAPELFVHTGTVTAFVTSKTEAKIDDGVPLPPSQDCIGGEYGRTKNEAERLVLSYDKMELSSGRRLLRTCVLRCPPMFGEGDPYVLTPVIDIAAKTRIVPTISSLTQVAYVGNVALAFPAAINKFQQSPDKVAGEAFFVMDDLPVRPLHELVASVLDQCKQPYWFFPMPRIVLLLLAMILHILVSLVTKVYSLDLSQFQLTPPRIRLALRSYVFDDSRARAVLGYTPKFDPEQSIQRSVTFYSKRLRR